MNRSVWLSLIALLLASSLNAEDLIVSGRVLDSNGVPVPNATVATFWRANGSISHSDGTPFDLSKQSDLEEYWGRMGQMAPMAPDISQAVTDERGRFELSVRNRRQRFLAAMDEERDRCGIVVLADGDSSEQAVEITLSPVATVSATISVSPDAESCEWCHAYVELAPDPKRPLAIGRLISCGSFNRRLEFRLPPGDYQLDVYGSSSIQSEDIDLRIARTPKFTIRESDSRVDLGNLQLTAAPPDRSVLERDARDSGRWHDITKHFGESAPQWHSVDGRGIDHAKNIEQLRGKWVLLEFWGLTCAPCLRDGIPKLMEFYEANAQRKSKFEIVAICIDFSGEVSNMRQLESRLEPIESHVWDGKSMPFPVVLDNTFKTWERYGIPGLGTVVLIDPQGRVVEGDETTLQEILDKAK